MAKAKSEHPGLVKTAAEKTATMKKALARIYPVLKEIGSAAASLKSAADTADKAFRDQLTYCEKLLEKYTTKANEIAEIELDLEEAEGDKKAEAEHLKKHKKADGEAGAIREEYTTALEVFRTLSDVITETREKIDAAADRLESIRSGG